MSYQLPEPHGWIGANDHDPDAGVEGFTADQVLAAYLAGGEEAAKDKLDALRYRTLRGSLGLYGKSHTQMPVVSVPFDRELGYLPHGLDEALDACIRALAADGLVERKG